MRMLDSSVFTSTRSPDGDYWMSGTVYLYDEGTRFYVPIESHIQGDAVQLDVADAFRLLIAELPFSLAKHLQGGHLTRSAAVRPF